LTYLRSILSDYYGIEDPFGSRASFQYIGALVLLIPTLSPWKPLSKDYILAQKDTESDDPKYIQVQDLVGLATSLSGFILLGVGFVLQLIGTILS
jgi:hypothetical protein